MKRLIVILLLLLVLFSLAFWIWQTALLLDENNSLRMDNEKIKNERDNIDRLYNEKVKELERLKKKNWDSE